MSREELRRTGQQRAQGVASESSASRTAAPAQPGVTATRTDAGALKQRASRTWQLWKPHVRTYGPQILINHGVTLAIIVAIAVIAGVMVSFRAVPATIGSLWLVANLAPINMAGAELGFVPLLPAIALVWGHARRATTILGKKISVRGLRVFVTLSILIPLAITLLAWFMVWDASKVYDLAAPNLGTALLSTLLVNGSAVVIGMRPRVWRALLLRNQFGTWPVESFRLATRFLLWMCAAGALFALVYLLSNLDAVAASYEITHDVAGKIGLTAVALAYVPNIVLGAVAVLLGGEFTVGPAMVTLFGINNVTLPPVPVAAALPNAPVPGGPFLLAVPVLVVVACVWTYVRGRGFVESPLATALGAGGAALIMGFCLAWLSGGKLGVYGEAGPLEWLFAVELAVWLLVPAAVVFYLAARQGHRVVEDVQLGVSAPAGGSVAAEHSDADLDEAPSDGRGSAGEGQDGATDEVSNDAADEATDDVADGVQKEVAEPNEESAEAGDAGDAGATDTAENAGEEEETVDAEEPEREPAAEEDNEVMSETADTLPDGVPDETPDDDPAGSAGPATSNEEPTQGEK